MTRSVRTDRRATPRWGFLSTPPCRQSPGLSVPPFPTHPILLRRPPRTQSRGTARVGTTGRPKPATNREPTVAGSPDAVPARTTCHRMRATSPGPGRGHSWAVCLVTRRSMHSPYRPSLPGHIVNIVELRGGGRTQRRLVSTLPHIQAVPGGSPAAPRLRIRELGVNRLERGWRRTHRGHRHRRRGSHGF